MGMKRVQMQAGLSMPEFLKRYGTESQCEAALMVMRWPDGFRCPVCRDDRCATVRAGHRQLWQCYRCRHQTSLIAGTVFEATKLPLTKWFLAIYLVTQSKNAISALSLRRQIGVSYPTAWLVKHKLMNVMAEIEDDRQLDGRIELDDAALGGERPGHRGISGPNKVSFLAAVSTTDGGRPRYVKLTPLPNVSTESVGAWSDRALADTAKVVFDGLPAIRKTMADYRIEHTPIVTGSGRAAAKHPSFRWVNTVIGNAKRAISGTYHAFGFAKYARAYLAEFSFRFNHRFDLSRISIALIRACANAGPRNARVILAA
ncbi:ISXO2-like transposase domain protein [mine drainage metagenome]|uniref:ISXO2-like transposase domain protein n=1 Tax=mine drainage metagenome TaxID=410659 RepID=A0A1J5SSZ1_9ZZZZ